MSMGHDHGAHGPKQGGAPGSASHAGHGAAPADFGRAFAVGIALNLSYVVIEAGYGIATNSLALVADAGHNLSDVLGLAIAWGAAVLSKRRPTAKYTYGLRGTSILAALFNAVFLLIVVGAIAWEAVRRFSDPQPVAAGTVMIVAAIGIGVNAVTAWLFASGRKSDLNIRGAFLHMAADAAVSAAVVVAGLLIFKTGWLWLDPAISLVIAGVIVWGTWGLLKESVAMALQAVPDGIAAAEVEAYLAALPGVAQVHDLHIWSMSTTEVAMTAHLVMPDAPPAAFLGDLAVQMQQRFRIAHPTVQIERASDRCALEPSGVV